MVVSSFREEPLGFQFAEFLELLGCLRRRLMAELAFVV
jgi:hypothetical protein